MLSVLQNYKSSINEPYPHIVIHNALPQKLYDQLANEWPKEQLLETEPYDNGVCYRLKADKMLQQGVVSDLWREFTEYHTSIDFFKEVKTIFNDLIEDTNPTLGPRGWAEKSSTIWTDCQTVMHEPSTTTTRTPHIDNPREIYAGLLYMPYSNDTSQGGDFQIYNRIGNVSEVDKEKGRQVLKDNLGTVANTVPYKANTFVMFLNNSANAIHGVSERVNAIMHRRSVNIIAEYSRQSGNSMFTVNEI